jgi:hypothetical protein
MAAETTKMARKTADLAASTVSGTAQADAHHQQSNWPLVVAIYANILDWNLVLRCKNIGLGPCTYGRIVVTGINGVDMSPQHLGTGLPPCGAGDSTGELLIPITPITTMQSIAFVIEYATIFGSFGRSQALLGRENAGGFTLSIARPEMPQVLPGANVAAGTHDGSSATDVPRVGWVRSTLRRFRSRPSAR